MTLRSPGQVRIFVTKAVKNWQWVKVASNPDFSDLAQCACIEPVLRLLAPKNKTCSPIQKACIRATITGAEWPPERLHKAGVISDSTCSICGAQGSGKHRSFLCPAAREVRNGVDFITTQAAERGLGSTSFWGRLLAPALEQLFEPPSSTGPAAALVEW